MGLAADTAAAAASALQEVLQQIGLVPAVMAAAGIRQGMQECHLAAAGMVCLLASNLIACHANPAAAIGRGLTLGGLWRAAAAGTGRQIAAGGGRVTGRGTVKVTVNGTVNGMGLATTATGTAAEASVRKGIGIRAADRLLLMLA